MDDLLGAHKLPGRYVSSVAYDAFIPRPGWEFFVLCFVFGCFAVWVCLFLVFLWNDITRLRTTNTGSCHSPASLAIISKSE